MARAEHGAWPKAGAAEHGTGRWEDISGQHTARPVSSLARPAGSETPFCSGLGQMGPPSGLGLPTCKMGRLMPPFLHRRTWRTVGMQ